LPGALSPPVILSASFFNILLFYFLIVAEACGLPLEACIFNFVDSKSAQLRAGQRPAAVNV